MSWNISNRFFNGSSTLPSPAAVLVVRHHAGHVRVADMLGRAPRMGGKSLTSNVSNSACPLGWDDTGQQATSDHKSRSFRNQHRR